MALIKTETLLSCPLCHSLVELFTVSASKDTSTNWSRKRFQDKKYFPNPFSGYL